MNFYAIYSTGADRLKRKSLQGRNPAFIRINPALINAILMRISLIVFILTVGLVQVYADSYGQQVSLNVKNETVKTVIKKVQAQSGYSFLYTDEMLRNTTPVTVNLKKATIEETLLQIFTNQPLSYEIQDKTVILQRKTPSLIDKLKDALNLNQIEVTGTVVDEQNRPISGATIAVKGTSIATITDAKGTFHLQHVPDNATIVISFIGYQKQELPVIPDMGKIKLLVASNQLDAVQVIAYGESSERLSTGDISVVHAKEIEEQPVTNVLSAIEGHVPGLLITQQSGMPGSSYTVQIRGQNSIQNGNDPLYVIDGVPYSSQLNGFTSNPAGGNPLNFINPNDIESVSVLKDADATSIYGSRAANGAILITTKKGKAGKATLNLNVSEGEANVPLKVQWMNTQQYLQMEEEAFRNDGVIANAASAPELFDWNTSTNMNWQKLAIGSTAHYTNIQGTISGGSENTQYLVGGGYNRQTTVFPFSGPYENASVHFSLTTTSADKRFKLTLTANYLVNSTNFPSTDLTPEINSPPDTPPAFNKDGSLNWANETWPSGNPFSILLEKYNAQTNNLVSNAVLSYQVLKGLDIKSSFGYTDLQANEDNDFPIAAQDPAYNPTGSSAFNNNSTKSWIIEPQATYVLNIGSNNQFNVLLGSTFEQNNANGQQVLASGFTSDALILDAAAAPTLHTNISNAVYKYNALYGRINYNYEDKYLVDLNWRRDGSSRFGPDNQFHDFESMGAAWIFTKEDVVKKFLPFLSFGKLRGSYGTTGNDQIGDYNFYSLYQTTYNSYQGSGGLTPNGLYNPNLQWELTKKFEGGLELGFFKDRIILQASYFNNRSSNQLLGSTLPGITGFGSIPENFPATVQNAGLEFVLNTINLKSTNFNWTSSFNLTSAQNKLIAFPDLAASPYQYSLIIGQPLNIQKVVHFLGVDPATGVYVFAGKNGPTTTPDYNTDRTILLSTTPKFYGGFQNSFSYKKFQLDVFVSFRKQLGINPLLQQIWPAGVAENNEPVQVLNRWQQPGDISSTELFTQNFGSNAVTQYAWAKASDYYYVDASFIRLQNLSISYQFSGKWVETAHLQGLKLFIQGQNLLTITRYKGMDPENQSLFALPPLRTLTAGIQLSL